MRFLFLFTILVCFVAYSQQQRRGRIQVIRNLDDNNDASLVQRYEETPPIRPSIRKPARSQSTAPRTKKSRPIKSKSKPKSAEAPPASKVEKRKFNVLLNTNTGFQETAGYSYKG